MSSYHTKCIKECVIFRENSVLIYILKMKLSLNSGIEFLFINILIETDMFIHSEKCLAFANIVQSFSW